MCFNQDVQTFSSLAIATFYVPYFLCACLTYGIAVPSASAHCTFLTGWQVAALGRLVGHLLHRLDAQSGTFADDAGTYALGSGGRLARMARMTISLCVILLEATGNISNLLPLMLALMAWRTRDGSATCLMKGCMTYISISKRCMSGVPFRP